MTSTDKVRNILLTDFCTIRGAQIAPPPRTRPEDLGGLLDLCAGICLPESVILLSGKWADYLQVTREIRGADPDHPAVVTWGPWSAKVTDPEGEPWIRWTHGHAPGVGLWTCDVDALAPRGRSTPLVHTDPIPTMLMMQRWTDLTGTTWHGTPGMTGNSLLRDRWTARTAPRWTTRARIDWDAMPTPERPYSARQWSREAPDGEPHVHGYDANAAYLSALVVVELPADDLEHRVRPEFDSGHGGLWRVELADWPEQWARRLPDPAGYGAAEADGTRWLTTPTMTLLSQLAQHAADSPFAHPGFRIVESWTAPTRRVTRPLAETLRDLITEKEHALEYAAKRVYQEVWGTWRRPGGRVFRPDWHYTVIAQARANLWRKMLTAAADESAFPLRIETDAVYYASDVANWESAAPAAFRLGTGLGGFKKVDP